MRTILVYLTGAAFLCATPAFADPPGVQPAKVTADDAAPKTREQRLDELFEDLKRERNERAADRLASRIWKEWNSSGSSVTDLMMKWSQEAMEKKKFDVALDFLDQVVTLSPRYAEGWNRRATVHFMMHNFAKSMADIDRTLQLEPRHFGALSGMAAIMKETERKELALEAFQRVLDIYPMMRSAQNEVATISEELTGEGI
jgi:tetratricopeptide (TPR) repeat protein